MIRFAGAFRALGILVLLAVLAVVAVAIGAGGAYWYLAPKLPSAETLRDVRLQVPLRVYTRDQKLSPSSARSAARRCASTKFRSG